MMNYEKKPHIATLILVYISIFMIFILDAAAIFMTLTIVNFFYSLFNANINFDDVPIMNLLSSLIISFLLLVKKRDIIEEGVNNLINEMNKIL